jgi:hypothetical protein
MRPQGLTTGKTVAKVSVVSDTSKSVSDGEAEYLIWS